MARKDRLLELILPSTSDANIKFNDLCRLLRYLGFNERIRSGHHIFTQEGIADIINIQPEGAKAKSYQVKQVRMLILKYRLGGSDD